MSERVRATGWGVVAIGLWSTLAVLTAVSGALPPFQTLATAFGVAGLIGLGVVLRSSGPGWRALRQPWPAFALTVTALFGYHALFFVALRRAPVLEANLINYLWPLLIVVFAALFAGARVRRGQWLGTALGVLGAVLVVTRGRALTLDPAHVPGYLAALGAALVWAAYSVLNRRHAQVPPLSIVVCCLAVAVLGAIAHLAFETMVRPTPGQWVVLVAMGIGPLGAAFLFWDIGTKRGELALLGTLSYATPLLSTGWLLLSGRAQPHWTQGVALVLLLAGAWLSVRAVRASA